MSAAKAKGTSAETAVVAYLKERGFKNAHRNPPAGSKDVGDIGGIYGVCLEVKAHTRPRHNEWLKEVEREARTLTALGLYSADIAAVVHKPAGLGAASVSGWHVIMTLEQFSTLLGFYTDY